ncbi:hypothetical protein C0995_001448, partial [Termitomyces sp. Mi166
MTVSSVNLANLRNAKNAVIGNPSAKLQLARDPSFVRNLVDCLDYHDARADIRIEAAHVVASLSYGTLSVPDSFPVWLMSLGSDEALLALLRAHAPHALLYALAHFTKDDSPALRAAFARALRAIAVSAADAVGPSQWGLGPASSVADQDAQDAVEFLFLPESLDILLPLLVDTAPQVPTSIAQLLAATIRLRHHRLCVSEWLPLAERMKAKEKDVRPRRGWEKAAVGPGPARLGGWTGRQLVGLIGSKDVKLEEAALGALAALAKDSTDVASALARPSNDREVSPLTTILNLTKSRSPDVQLAACLCAAHILRALPRHQQDESSTRVVMNTVNRMIASPLSPTDDLGSPHASIGTSSSGNLGNLGQVTLAQRTRACFVLYHLVADDASLCQAAFDRGCLAQLIGLVTALPLPPTPPSLIAEAELVIPGNGNGNGQGVAAASAGGSRVYIPPPEDESKTEEEEVWCEPEGRALLREAALTAIAAISLFDNDVRRSLTEPALHPSYHHPSTTSFFPSSFSTSPPTTTASAFSPSPSPPAPSPSGPPPLLPVLLAGLVHPSAGVRYAACQCVRAMSRAVAVLRTNIVDSGLGMGVWRRCVKGRVRASASASGKGTGEGERERTIDRAADGYGYGIRARERGSASTGDGVNEREREREREREEWEGEKDKRVIGAGLAVVCNLVNDFSPLRAVLLEDGLVERLVEILGYDDAALRVSALWAIKNLLYRSGIELKERVVGEVGWGRVVGFLEDTDVGIREQAFNVLRNVTESEDGVELVYREVGEDVLLDHVANALKSANDDEVLQAAYLLANLANDTEAHQARILSNPQILPALHAALVAATITASSPSTATATAAASTPHTYTPRAQARGPLVSCVAQLAVTGAAQVQAAGFEGALRH